MSLGMKGTGQRAPWRSSESCRKKIGKVIQSVWIVMNAGKERNGTMTRRTREEHCFNWASDRLL